jgi:hypothetical protein
MPADTTAEAIHAHKMRVPLGMEPIIALKSKLGSWVSTNGVSMKVALRVVLVAMVVSLGWLLKRNASYCAARYAVSKYLAAPSEHDADEGVSRDGHDDVRNLLECVFCVNGHESLLS